MPPPARRPALLLIVVVAASSVLAACRGTTTVSSPSTVTTTVTPPPPTTTSASPTHSAAPAKHTGLAAPTMRQLPGGCGHGLTRSSVAGALGKKITGPTVFIVGQPDSSISRTGYINCRYGGDPNHDEPNIEIQVSLYTTPAKATARVPANVGDFEQNGATAAKVTVDGSPATTLIGGTAKGFYPSILLVLGNRTVVVSIKPGVLPGGQLSARLIALAGLAAKATSA